MTQDELHILVLALLCNLLSGVDYDLCLTNMVLCFAACGVLVPCLCACSVKSNSL